MKNPNENYYLETSIQFIIIACLVLVPVFFSTSIHNAFTIEKNTIFRICTLVASGLCLINYIYYPRKTSIPKLFWLVPAFWVAGLLSTIFGLQPILSTWGIHLRMDGLVNMTFLLAWFFVLFFNVNSWTKLKRVLWTIGLTSIIPVGYALMQKFGLDTIDWKSVVESERVFGTTGNPAYLGAYLMFVVPVTFYLAYVSRGIKKYGLGLLLLLQIITLIFTLTRAAYLGLAVEVFVVGVAYFLLTNRRPIALGIIGLFTMLTIFVGALNLYQGFADIFSGNRYIQRLSQLTQTEEGTGKDRLEMWKIAGTAIQERPLLGSGLSTYSYYFSQYYPNYMDARPLKDRYSNYSHNYWLDNGVAHGLVGLLLLIAIYISFTLAGYKKALDEEDPGRKLLYIALFAAVWGYLTQATFNIETVITWVYSYTFLALLLAAIYRTSQSDEYLTYQPTIVKQIGVTFFSIMILVGIWYLGINPARADSIYFQLNYAGDLTADQRVELSAQARDLTPYYEFAYMKMADAYVAQLDLANNTEAAPGLFAQTVENIERAIAIDPLNYKNYMFMGQVYGNWAKIDRTKLELADEYLQKAVDIGPTRLEILWNWGNIYYDLNDFVRANEYYDKALILNQNIGETYYYQARSAYRQQDIAAGDAYLQTAVAKGYVFDQAGLFSDLALITYQTGQRDLANQFALRANQIEPRDQSAMVEVQTLLESGQTEAARTKLEEYKQILPGLSKYNI